MPPRSDDRRTKRTILVVAAGLALCGAAQGGEPAPAAAAGDLAWPDLPAGRDAKSRTLYLTLIGDMREAGKTHAALAHLDAFDKSFPRSDDAAILRADCLVDIGNHAAASAIYTKMQRGRYAAQASAGLGRIEALSGRWPAAVSHYQRAVASAPTSSVFLNDLGFALLKAGQAGEAAFRLRQAAELAPADARVRNNLVLALAASGDNAGARRLLESVQDPADRTDLEAELTAQTRRTATHAAPAAAD